MYSRSRLARAGRINALARLLPLLVLFALFLIGGILLAVRQSMGLGVPGVSGKASLHYYTVLLSDPWFISSFFFSLKVGFISAVLSIALGVPLAYGIWRAHPVVQKAAILYKIPIVLPHIVVAFVAFVLLTPSGLVSSFLKTIGVLASQESFPRLIYSRTGFGLVAAYVYKEMPFVMLLVFGVLQRIPEQMIRTAQMLGAGSLGVFTRIVLPQLVPIIHTSFIILFLYSFGAFDIPFLIGSSRPQMLSVFVFDRYFRGDLADRPTAMATLVLMFLFAAVFVVIYSRVAQHIEGRTRKL